MQTSIEEEFQMTFIHGISGSAAAVLSTSILYPFENIKTRMQVNQKPNQRKDYCNKKDLNFKEPFKEIEKPLLMTSLDRFNRKIKIEEVSISKTRIEPKFQTSPLKSTDKIFPEKNETLETFPIYKKEVKPISPLLHLKDFQNPEKKKGHCKRTNSAILTRRSLMHQNVESFTPKLQDSDSAKSEAGSPQIKSPLFKDSPERKSNFKHTISKTKTMEIQKSSHYREKEGESAGMWDVFLDVIKKEGVMGLYKGITPLLIGNFISYGVYFFWYEAFKKILKIKTADILGHSKIALFSGLIATTCTNPFWIINARMTLQKGNQSFVQTVLKILEIEGFFAFFKGILPSLILVANPIVQFSIYEFIKNKLKESRNKTLVYLFGGGISKALATILTYPYQVIRTNIHIRKNKMTFYEIFKEIYQDNGWKGFFKGLSPKLSQTVLNSALLLLIYEKVFYFVWMMLFKQPMLRKILRK